MSDITFNVQINDAQIHPRRKYTMMSFPMGSSEHFRTKLLMEKSLSIWKQLGSALRNVNPMPDWTPSNDLLCSEFERAFFNAPKVIKERIFHRLAMVIDRDLYSPRGCGIVKVYEDSLDQALEEVLPMFG
jgi:hypothetical protein